MTYANGVDPDQSPCFAASDLGLHCFICVPFLRRWALMGP